MEKKSKCYAGTLCDGDMCCSSDSTSSIQSEEKIYQCLNTAHRELGRKFPCKDCREFPSQPNSEENPRNCCEMCYHKFPSGLIHCLGIATCPCHSLKPEEVKEAMEEFECVQTKWHLEKCKKCTPLPDTTEEKKKHSMLCKTRNVDGKFYAGSYEGMKEPEDCDCHNDTSDEWWEIEFKQKFSNYNLASEAYANGKNYKAIDFVIDFIKSLLSQSEQRVRKEMVEKISWLTRYERSKFRANLSEVPEEGTEPMLLEKEVLDIINLISK